MNKYIFYISHFIWIPFHIYISHNADHALNKAALGSSCSAGVLTRIQ
jgi:hypothetical protein